MRQALDAEERRRLDAIDDWMDEVAWRRLRGMVKFTFPTDGMPVLDAKAFAAYTPEQLGEFPPDWIEAAKVSWHRPDGGMRQATLNAVFRQPRKKEAAA